MEKVLNQILTELKSLNQRVNSIESGQQETQKNVQYLTKDVQVLTKDVQVLTKDVQVLTKDVQVLKIGQGKLQKDVTGIKNELSYIWDDIKKIDKRLSTQEEELVILKRFK